MATGATGVMGKKYVDGEVIYRQGDRGDSMFVLQNGRVEIFQRRGEREIVLATLGPGEIFGEMALFDQQERSASAVAEGEARVLTVDKKRLFASMSRDPTLAFKVLSSMSARIRHLDRQVSQSAPVHS